MFNIVSHQGNANKNDPEIQYYTCQNTYNKNSSDSTWWHWCRARRTFLHCWWECKLIQEHWKSIWQFLRNQRIVLPKTQLDYFWAYTQRYYSITQGHFSALFINLLPIILVTEHYLMSLNWRMDKDNVINYIINNYSTITNKDIMSFPVE